MNKDQKQWKTWAQIASCTPYLIVKSNEFAMSCLTFAAFWRRSKASEVQCEDQERPGPPPGLPGAPETTEPEVSRPDLFLRSPRISKMVYFKFWGNQGLPYGSIYTCVYTYIHTYRHTDIQTYRHTDIHTYIRTCTYMYVRTYIHTYIHIHPSIHTYLRTYMHACMQTYIHTYIHIYILIHTYIHIYIYWYIHTYIHMFNTHIYIYI